MLEDELLMLCWLLCEDTELGRTCWDAQTSAPGRSGAAHRWCLFAPYLVGVRHRLAGHAGSLPALRYCRDAVGGQSVLLGVSSMLGLHHGGSIVLLLLLLVLLTAGVGRETTTARLDGGRRGGEKERTNTGIKTITFIRS